MRWNQRGGVIVEAIGALVVVSVGVFAVAFLTGGIVQSHRSSDQSGIADMAATNQMESLLGGLPLNLDGELSLGRHPSGTSSYFGILASGDWTSATVTLETNGYPYVGAWNVVDASGNRCLRRLEVSVWNADVTRRLAALETHANCP